MLPVNCGSHADYQNFVVINFRKYYPDPNTLAHSTWDIIEHFGQVIGLLLLILRVTVFTMVMTCTCWLIRKASYRYSLYL